MTSLSGKFITYIFEYKTSPSFLIKALFTLFMLLLPPLNTHSNRCREWNAECAMRCSWRCTLTDTHCPNEGRADGGGTYKGIYTVNAFFITITIFVVNVSISFPLFFTRCYFFRLIIIFKTSFYFFLNKLLKIILLVLWCIENNIHYLKTNNNSSWELLISYCFAQHYFASKRMNPFIKKGYSFAKEKNIFQ